MLGGVCGGPHSPWNSHTDLNPGAQQEQSWGAGAGGPPPPSCHCGRLSCWQALVSCWEKTRSPCGTVSRVPQTVGSTDWEGGGEAAISATSCRWAPHRLRAEPPPPCSLPGGAEVRVGGLGRGLVLAPCTAEGSLLTPRLLGEALGLVTLPGAPPPTCRWLARERGWASRASCRQARGTLAHCAWWLVPPSRPPGRGGNPAWRGDKRVTGLGTTGADAWRPSNQPTVRVGVYQGGWGLLGMSPTECLPGSPRQLPPLWHHGDPGWWRVPKDLCQWGTRNGAP